LANGRRSSSGWRIICWSGIIEERPLLTVLEGSRFCRC
jgi:hypothetical protein